MKKLLIIMPAIDMGGAQRFCLNLCDYLNSIEYTYQVVFLRRGESMEMKQQFTEKKIRFTELGYNKVFFSLFALRRFIKDGKYDIVLSTVVNVDFVAALALLCNPKSKLIIRKANVVFDNQRGFYTKLSLMVERHIAKYMVVLTEEMKEQFESFGFSSEKMVVINNMINLNEIDRKAVECVSERDISKSKYNIISNGRMVPEKRYDILLKAFLIVNENYPEVNLIIIGDGYLKEEIIRSVPKKILSNVFFLGFQSNPYKYMYNSKIFVLSSDNEGFPNVLIEAFACGIPVVSTNCKSGPKEIIKEGKNGLLVNTGDAEGLAKNIEMLISNEEMRSRLAKNARNDVKQYEITNIADKYVELFEKING